MFYLLMLLFRCLSALNSVKFNPRNTEDFVRPLWTALLYDLCCFSSDLVPSSEFRLYTSTGPSLGQDDSNVSAQTVANGDAKDVLPDFIVLLPVDDQTNSQDKIDNYLKKLKERIDPPFLKIANMYAPLLVELKRGPSRHHRRIDKFVIDLHDRMHAARSQVVEQGNCLFSSGKYANQQHVILVAATGQWWSMMIYSRILSKQFEPLQYEDLKLRNSIKETDIDISETLYPPKTSNLKELYITEIQEQEAKLCREHNKMHEKQTKAEQDKARDMRNEARTAEKEKQYQAWKELNNFIKECDGKHFTEELITHYYNLSQKTGLMSIHTSMDKFSGVAYSNSSEIVESHLYGQWSLPMKIGSPVSNAHLMFIKQRLMKVVKNRMC